MSLADVDGVAFAGISPVVVAHHFGILPTWLDFTSIGGCSPLVHVRHAAAAIASGLTDVVLITHGESGRSRVGSPRRAVDPSSPQGQFEAPYGPLGAPTLFPMGVLRYMRTYGLTHEELANVPVAQRRWAADVPRAMYREPITIDDVLASLGFVGRGEAGSFIVGNNTSPGGGLPMNTNGGGLSYTHTGMYGMFLIQESIRQLRHEAANQVSGVEVSMAQAVGGMFVSAATLVLGASSAAG